MEIKEVALNILRGYYYSLPYIRFLINHESKKSTKTRTNKKRKAYLRPNHSICYEY